eukprot:TRINITY_DN6605_c0_g1_i5.p1 TRINITY_DN6605_c0_g1~~TRINITY_DN6605_c0_g1_i5.p1  ORF type:complete len:253 (+),score=45.10 TRINITY_DN6605_c0_g1_i5:101-859(+)
MLWWQRRLDKPLSSMNPDRDLSAEFKEYFCKSLRPSFLRSYTKQPQLDSRIHDVVYSAIPKSPNAAKLLNYSAWYGRLLHQRAPGYLSNARQQRMAGLATVHVAQVLRSYLFQGKKMESGAGSSFTKQSHQFGWRDVYDIIVKWRQISEPNDPVWWVDRLSKEQFSEGFGAQTPMVSGQCPSVRYSPMVQMAFPILKCQLLVQQVMSERLEECVRNAKDLDELYQVMKRDFWVVTSCYSLRTGSALLPFGFE